MRELGGLKTSLSIFFPLQKFLPAFIYLLQITLLRTVSIFYILPGENLLEYHSEYAITLGSGVPTMFERGAI